MKDYAKNLYKSRRWQSTREAYMRRAGGLCEMCAAKGIVSAGEIVHHKIPVSQDNINNPAITLNFDNLELLCRDCHAKCHEPQTARRWRVDECGKVTAK